MSFVKLAELYPTLCLQSWLKEEGDDQNESDEDGACQRLEGPLGRVDKLPGGQVVQGYVCRLEPVPGYLHGQEGWRVKHQGRKRVKPLCKHKVEEKHIVVVLTQEDNHAKDDIADLGEKETD